MKCKLNKHPTNTANKISGVRNPHTFQRETFSLVGQRSQEEARKQAGEKKLADVTVAKPCRSIVAHTS